MTEQVSPYDQYWARKKLLAKVPHTPLKYWWDSDSLCEVERIYLHAIRNSPSLLDVGAGDLRLKRKFIDGGYAGVYHTLDPGLEFHHTYRNVDQVNRTYDAILLLDVIEHVPLQDGITMLKQFAEMVNPDGVLILQTPNARCVRSPLS